MADDEHAVATAVITHRDWYRNPLVDRFLRAAQCRPPLVGLIEVLVLITHAGMRSDVPVRDFL